MQFADLEFEDHPRDGRQPGSTIEWAFARFPNGWGLSVLRGMAFFNVHGLDYETCRFHPHDGPDAYIPPSMWRWRDDPRTRIGVLPVYDSILKHGTIEDVQREMDAVAALV